MSEISIKISAKDFEKILFSMEQYEYILEEEVRKINTVDNESKKKKKDLKKDLKYRVALKMKLVEIFNEMYKNGYSENLSDNYNIEIKSKRVKGNSVELEDKYKEVVEENYTPYIDRNDREIGDSGYTMNSLMEMLKNKEKSPLSKEIEKKKEEGKKHWNVFYDKKSDYELVTFHEEDPYPYKKNHTENGENILNLYGELTNEKLIMINEGYKTIEIKSSDIGSYSIYKGHEKLDFSIEDLFKKIANKGSNKLKLEGK